MVVLVAGLILLNLLFYLFLIAGWINLPVEVSVRKLSFSIIIPVRNEDDNIEEILQALEQQEYPNEQYEVIVVDDFSEDDTRKKVEAFRSKCKISIRNCALTQEEGKGKKRAITKGVGLSQFDHIITTDADCIMGNGWLAAYARHFADNQIVAGPVTIRSRTMFSKLQEIEFAGLIGFGAVTINRDDPSMCSGANLGFTKEAFNNVGGYANNIKIPSGDDEFLLYNINKAYPGKATFMKDRRAVVRTPPHETLASFVNQRKRWTSKWKYNKNRRLRLTAIFFFFENISLPILAILALFGWADPLLIMIFFTAKYILSTLFMNLVNGFLGNSITVLSPFLFQIIYPFHVLFMGLNSIFGSYTWKGRRY